MIYAKLLKNRNYMIHSKHIIYFRLSKKGQLWHFLKIHSKVIKKNQTL